MSGVKTAPGEELLVDSRQKQKLADRGRRVGLHRIERHVFLCGDLGESGCAGRKRMLKAWGYLKRRLKELGLSESGRVYRTRTHCMKVCKSGPIAVVYPEGVWYARCDPPALERIIQEHLVRGRIVEELRIPTVEEAQHRGLPAAPAPDRRSGERRRGRRGEEQPEREDRHLP